MTYEEWVKEFKPVLRERSWVTKEMIEEGILPDLYSDIEGIAGVDNIPYNCIWTITNCNGTEYLVNGMHRVNHIGNVRTSVPWKETVVIILSEPEEEEEE
jgi:hypothetical protein